MSATIRGGQGAVVLPERDLLCILEALGDEGLPVAEAGSVGCAAMAM